MASLFYKLYSSTSPLTLMPFVGFLILDGWASVARFQRYYQASKLDQLQLCEWKSDLFWNPRRLWSSLHKTSRSITPSIAISFVSVFVPQVRFVAFSLLSEHRSQTWVSLLRMCLPKRDWRSSISTFRLVATSLG